MSKHCKTESNFGKQEIILAGEPPRRDVEFSVEARFRFDDKVSECLVSLRSIRKLGN